MSEAAAELWLKFFHDSIRMVREARRDARRNTALLSPDPDLAPDIRDVPYATAKNIRKREAQKSRV